MSRTAARGSDLRVLGARGVPAADRALAALQAPDAWTARSHHWWGPVSETRGPRRSSRQGASRGIRERGRASGRATSRDSGRAGCGAGSRRSGCSSTCSPPASSRSPAGRASSALYDLPERVIPTRRSTRRCPTRTRSLRASRCAPSQARGALTEAGIVEHCRLRGGTARDPPARRRSWSRQARVRRVAVDDGGPPVLVAAEADARRRAAPARGASVPVRQPALGPAVPAPAASASST